MIGNPQPLFQCILLTGFARRTGERGIKWEKYTTIYNYKKILKKLLKHVLRTLFSWQDDQGPKGTHTCTDTRIQTT